MPFIENENSPHAILSGEAREAERYALMMDSILMDPQDLDPDTCPPDRRYFLDGKQAWVYEHGNICELVFVREE
jgi:hypothetical protein